ncbi:MFS transporter [Enterococcus sp. ALS3]|uniref:MFS transporter n=1 Tax=Enterococcus alishanensis TaxID=1303817 RepID=A0ABS6TH63_9ENTE|nr:MFS transporter [Enterococcus alishanensis]MBV7392314.1 MFS transporter [Enterococcus alishanensis]
MGTYQEDTKVQKNRWWILVSVALFTFMSTLDGSIVNIALPTMSKDLKVPMNQAEWVVSIYLMVVCSCLLLFGKVGDSFGKIKVYRVGTIIFTIGSLLCGFNHSLAFLLFGRIVQAVGASMTMATNSGIITEIFPMNERGRALGSIGAFVSLGSIAGPGLGGLILSQLPWSYIFWINVPVGLITILVGNYFLPKDLTMSRKKIDWLGFMTFSVTIMTFFGGVFIGQEVGYLHALPVSLVVVAVIAFVAFIQIEKKKANPLIVFSIFKNKMFTISLITAVLIFSSNFFINVVLPFYLQDARGLSASFAGLLMMVFPGLMIIGSPLSGYLTDKIGPKMLILTGLVLLSAAQLMYNFMDVKTALWYFTITTALMGLGNSLFQSPNNTMVMSSVTKENLGVAGSLNSFARNLGMVIGVSLSTTILYSGMSAAYGQKVTTYLTNRPDIFIFGMRVTFTASFVLCFVALILSIFRFRKGGKDGQ